MNRKSILTPAFFKNSLPAARPPLDPFVLSNFNIALPRSRRINRKMMEEEPAERFYPWRLYTPRRERISAMRGLSYIPPNGSAVKRGL